MQIAFLGLGQMGATIATHLLRANHTVTVWNRTPQACEPLVHLGATSAPTPAEALRTADIVFTMFFDDHALESILLDPATLAALSAGAIHVSLSTISVALADRLTEAHAAHHQRYICAPVFGRPAVAAEGKLWLPIAGPADAIAEIRPFLETFSRGITVIGDQPSQAAATKLAGNFLICSMMAGLAEAITFAEASAIDPAVLLETINSATFQSPLYATYGKLMLHPPEHPGATVTLGAKDTRLFREAAIAAQTPTPVADLAQQHLAAALQNNLADQEWSTGYLAQSRLEAHPKT